MSLVEKCWMVTSKISVIALLMITGIYFGKFVCPYIKKKKGAVAVSIVYITIMLVLYMIPPQIDNFSAYLIGVIAAFLVGHATTAMTTRIRSQLVHTHYPMLQKCN